MSAQLAEWFKKVSFYILVWLALAAIAVFVSPFIIVGWQALHWLQYGIWEPWPVWRALVYFEWNPPDFQWVGVQIIIGWFLQLPIAVAIPGWGMPAVGWRID